VSWLICDMVGKSGKEEGWICRENEEQSSRTPQGSRGEESNDWSKKRWGPSQGRGNCSEIPSNWVYTKEVSWILKCLRCFGKF